MFGEHHHTVAGTLNNLAILAFQRNRFREAADRFRELIGVWAALVGPDHPNTLSTTNNLGMSLRSAGDLEEAERILERVLEGRRRTLGADHPEVGASLLNLASVVQRRHNFARSLALAEEALPILTRAHPDGHPLVAIGHMTLGRAHLGLGAARLSSLNQGFPYCPRRRRLFDRDGEHVCSRYTDYRAPAAPKTMTLDAMKSICRFLLDVLSRAPSPGASSQVALRKRAARPGCQVVLERQARRSSANLQTTSTAEGRHLAV